MSFSSATPPLILTLAINQEAFSFFNRLRQQFFPPEINFLQAHLTLFHYLPFSSAEIIEQLAVFVTAQKTFTIEVAAPVSIGKGVAYKLVSGELQLMHKKLQQLWKPILKPQDTQKLWPHITVQNKVSPQQAKETLQYLQQNFDPFTIQGVGLSVWEYLGGPWTFVKTLSFSEETHP